MKNANSRSLDSVTHEGQIIRSLKVQGFSGLRNLEMEDLGQVNLIGGRNNAGKTALLEAIFIASGGSNLGLVPVVMAFRGLEQIQFTGDNPEETPWDVLFSDYNTQGLIRFEVSDNRRRKHLTEIYLRPWDSQRPGGSNVLDLPMESKIDIRSISTRLPRILCLRYESGPNTLNQALIPTAEGLRVSTPPLPIAWQAVILPSGKPSQKEQAERYGRVEKTKEQDKILKSLQLIEPRLERLAAIPYNGAPTLHGDIGLRQMIPLTFLGEGLNRLASMVINISAFPHGVILIDEIDNGIHYSVLRDLWRVVWSVAQTFGAQIFATTHSFECVAAAQEIFSEERSEAFRYHRLDRMDNGIRSVTYDQGSLKAAVESGIEVR